MPMGVDDLLPIAGQLVDRIRVEDSMPVICLAQERVDHLRSPTSLDHLWTTVQNLDIANNNATELTHRHIVWVEAALRSPKGLNQDASSEETAKQIELWTCEMILPTQAFAKNSPFDPNPHESASPSYIKRFQLMAAAGLRLLSHLRRLVPSLKIDLNLRKFTCISSFTDLKEPWVCVESYDVARALLASEIELLGPARSRSLISSMLKEVVKPLFMKSKSNAITEQGRKSINSRSGHMDHSHFESSAKPWKFRDVYITTVFKWLLIQLDKSSIEENWPFVIPPMLTLIDDEDINSKVKGCEAVILLLEIVPSPLLKRTGLPEVFEDALMPCLAYLPTLTNEAESIVLLSNVYPALVRLNKVLYPNETDLSERARLLHRLVREGILRGYAHASEHIKITGLLMNSLSSLVKELGILSTTHLKDIVPIIVDILRNPFAASFPPLILSTLDTISTIMLVCWPRIPHYKGDIIQGIVVCWFRIDNTGVNSNDAEAIKSYLAKALALLEATTASCNDVGDDLVSTLGVRFFAIRSVAQDEGSEHQTIDERPALCQRSSKCCLLH